MDATMNEGWAIKFDDGSVMGDRGTLDNAGFEDTTAFYPYRTRLIAEEFAAETPLTEVVHVKRFNSNSWILSFPETKSEKEVRVVDPTTGGQKGAKLERYDLIPAGPLKLLAEHYGRGAKKYEERNWEKGYKWSLSFAAMMRHAWAFWRGEDIDAETGSPHLVAVAWHAFCLLEFAQRHPKMDDRSKS